MILLKENPSLFNTQVYHSGSHEWLNVLGHLCLVGYIQLIGNSHRDCDLHSYPQETYRNYKPGKMGQPYDFNHTILQNMNMRFVIEVEKS